MLHQHSEIFIAAITIAVGNASMLTMRAPSATRLVSRGISAGAAVVKDLVIGEICVF